MRIISDIKTENETKNADNKENTVKAGCCRWSPFMYFISIFRFDNHQ